MRRAAIAMVLVGCYHGPRAARDVAAAWRGHTRAELEARWGRPARVDGDTLTWAFATRHVELPAAEAHAVITPTSVDVGAALSAGAVWTTSTTAVARLDAQGRVAAMEGATLHWGPPRTANLRWGTLFGAHVGMGRLGTTATPLPSGGLYLGGMLSPTLGLVGTFSMVSGTGDAGGAIGFAWGIAAQQWFAPRLAVRIGPAMVLAFRPGFDGSVGVGHRALDTFGVAAAASVALVRTRVFALDLRAELITSTGATFGDLGVGVNLN